MEPVGNPGKPLSEPVTPLHDRFVALFNVHHHPLFRVLDRLSGDPDLAADLVQEAFVRLYRRASMPDAPEAWLISVAMNLLRNTRNTAVRRLRLLGQGGELLVAPRPTPEEEVEAADQAARVRAALTVLPAREQRLLLLRAEGYSYRDMADALGLNEASVGTLLARARDDFRRAYGEAADAS